MWIFDAHLDLAMNAIEWNRDLTQSVATIRESEKHRDDKLDRGKGTVAFPDMRRGNVLMCVATLIARIEHNAFSPVQGWRSQAQAWAMTQAQLAWYECMQRQGQMRLVHDAASLQSQLECIAAAATSQSQKSNAATPDVPIGFVLSLEGADAIIDLDYLHRLHDAGLRALGPAHYGRGVYAFGTDANGSFGANGLRLLQEMAQLNIILDVTHLCDTCFWEAMDVYDGPIWASHQNCRALVPHNRQFSDEQILALIERNAVIGSALDAWMLVEGWQRGTSDSATLNVSLQNVADHIDHICQLAGSDRHCGFGTDLDGAYGYEQTPHDVNNIADINGLLSILSARGYTSDALDRIASENFVSFLTRAFSD